MSHWDSSFLSHANTTGLAGNTLELYLKQGSSSDRDRPKKGGGGDHKRYKESTCENVSFLENEV